MWIRLLRFSGRFMVMRRTIGAGSSTRITSSLIVRFLFGTRTRRR
ncbi:MAG: hypothetical protein KatS3mg010_1867 [Acidimicrobiia bacterium]|nr:MAG: hypothetical protein KatS3mg010_1867 [Acidimicrobiia bacterium]